MFAFGMMTSSVAIWIISARVAGDRAEVLRVDRIHEPVRDREEAAGRRSSSRSTCWRVKNASSCGEKNVESSNIGIRPAPGTLSTARGMSGAVPRKIAPMIPPSDWPV